MIKKILIYFTLFSFLNFVGCSSTTMVTAKEYSEINDENGGQKDIIVYTNNDKKYNFATGFYYIKNDTLTGDGFVIINENEEPYKGSIPFSQIKLIYIDEDSGVIVGNWFRLGLFVVFVVLLIASIDVIKNLPGNK